MTVCLPSRTICPHLCHIDDTDSESAEASLQSNTDRSMYTGYHLRMLIYKALIHPVG